ncbi:luciferase [Actinomadura sp. NBRC 104412]|uniref:LLM class flavin-dependent oxidoreductase n=1 Tax=Actinomadura sp. NBRC 104412 TaxID=3032203 RepID=UPI0024A24B51|nr:LLM class flavin-dependent oxidoreductase [Actinomadura sp. NBRC 104412]GLZ06964.1 luciferase [Actinomadura sp. NBRC 104412]
MEVVVFDLMPYAARVDHLVENGELPWPLERRHFDPDTAVRTYADHLRAWELLDELGYDGVGFNEHHTSPYGLMNSPNLLAAAASQRTRRLRLHIYANLLPLHEPLRVAEELAMLDCMSGGRVVAGFARGIPREHTVYGVPMAESRARFEEAYEIVRALWTDEVTTYKGRFWSYSDVAIWPRPVQQPHPPTWVPVTSSKETIEWAGRNNVAITPGLGHPGLRDDVLRYYASCLREAGHTLTPDHVHLNVDAYVADDKAQAVREAGPHLLYFNRTLFSHGNETEVGAQRKTGYVSASSLDYVRPENLPAARRAKSDYRDQTMADIEREAANWAWGSPDEVRDRILDQARQAGAGKVLVNLNRGSMPGEMFQEQIRRFARDVLPALHEYEPAIPESLR